MTNKTTDQQTVTPFGHDLKDVITLSRFDFEDMLIYAQRYAIGRMTFASQDVCNLINAHIDWISVKTLSVIKTDIEQQRDRGNLGNPTIDAPVWLATLAAINARLEAS